MVDLRPPVQFPGLDIRVRPGSNERFYLSGDTPPFTLVAENSTNDPFDGMIVVHWVPNVGSWLDGESLRVQLRAHETRDFPLKSPWLATEGVVTCRLSTNYEPRSLLSSPPGSPTPPPIGSFEFLCTFRVWDRGSYQSDRAERTSQSHHSGHSCRDSRSSRDPRAHFAPMRAGQSWARTIPVGSLF